MTKDEIIEMAKQSGAMFDHITWVERDLLPVFERFAKLVAQHERSKYTKLYEEEIRSIREAATQYGIPSEDAAGMLLFCEEFARMVAEKEREAVAKWIMGKGFSTGHGESTKDLLDELEWQIAEREREACALIADKSYRIFRDTKDAHDRNSPNSEPFNPDAFGFSNYAIEESLRITSAIRARGQE